jgi:glycine dehydrogenase subunit 1
MRYLPQTQDNRNAMLKAIGVSTVDDLYKDVPDKARFKGEIDIDTHKGEIEVERLMASLADRNLSATKGPFFLGAGTYYHHIPATVDHIIQRSEYLTAYTPYQPEIAQGTLTAIFEFQTFIAQLTGQEIANASLYDGATATAEAALMTMRLTKRNKAVIVGALHPDYLAVLNSYMGNIDGVVYYGAMESAIDNTTACVIVQVPDFHGTPRSLDGLRAQCDAAGAMLVVVVNEIISLGLLPAPIQADIVCGEAQSIGLPMSFGGPHLGFFATKEKFVRQMPGRVCGMTKDAQGRRGFVLTLSTREQHIRREKATSNICTNQGLCALAFTVHMALLGEDGFKQLARLNHEAACRLADALDALPSVSVVNKSFFNEFVVQLPINANMIIDQLADKNIIAGYALDDNQLLVAATELTTEEDIEIFVKALGGLLKL